MPACVECHRAKLKCDQANPCSRCIRLGIECVPRISRQGQRPKRQRKQPPEEERQPEEPQQLSGQLHEVQKANNADDDDGLIRNSEDGNVVDRMTAYDRFHFGVRYLIHSWISFAFARRSFSLLSRACRLAAKCNVPMDDIFSPDRQHILNPILYNPRMTAMDSTSQQQVFENPKLQWTDLPLALIAICNVGNTDSRQGRYLLVREAKNGESRFLVSDEFQQDIASLWLIEETWKANDKPVVQIFLNGPTDFDKFTKAIQYQMSLYTSPDRKPECVRMNGLHVKKKQEQDRRNKSGCLSEVQVMDLIYAFEIVTLEHSFYVSEFVHPQQGLASPDAHTTSTAGGCSNMCFGDLEASCQSTTDPLQEFDNLVPNEETDKEFEAFLALITD